MAKSIRPMIGLACLAAALIAYVGELSTKRVRPITWQMKDGLVWLLFLSISVWMIFSLAHKIQMVAEKEDTGFCIASVINLAVAAVLFGLYMKTRGFPTPEIMANLPGWAVMIIWPAVDIADLFYLFRQR